MARTSVRGISSFFAAEPTVGGRVGLFCTGISIAQGCEVEPQCYPHSSLAAARAAVITAACRASVSSDHRAFQLPAVPDGDA